MRRVGGVCEVEVFSSLVRFLEAEDVEPAGTWEIRATLSPRLLLETGRFSKFLCISGNHKILQVLKVLDK